MDIKDQANNLGLIFVVFGNECDRMAAHCVAYSRQYTKLPITILSNLNEYERNVKWKEIDNIDFIHIDLPLEQNRQVKTTLPKYTPYEKTLYLDADSIIQHKDFDEKIIEMFNEETDLILNLFCTYPYLDNRFQNIYLRAVEQFNCTMPLEVYNGAFIGFKKGITSEIFFELWNHLWIQFGSQREMPPLACAINKLQSNYYSTIEEPLLTITKLPEDFFAPDSRNDASFVQHNYHQDFFQRIGTEPVELAHANHHQDDYGFTQLYEIDKNTWSRTPVS